MNLLFDTGNLLIQGMSFRRGLLETYFGIRYKIDTMITILYIGLEIIDYTDFLGKLL